MDSLRDFSELFPDFRRRRISNQPVRKHGLFSVSLTNEIIQHQPNLVLTSKEASFFISLSYSLFACFTRFFCSSLCSKACFRRQEEEA